MLRRRGVDVARLPQPRRAGARARAGRSRCCGARTVPARRTCSRRSASALIGRSCRTRNDREVIAVRRAAGAGRGRRWRTTPSTRHSSWSLTAAASGGSSSTAPPRPASTRAPARWSRVPAGPSCAGQGPAGAAAAPTSTGSSPRCGRREPSRGAATAARWRSETPCSAGSARGAAAARVARRLGRELADAGVELIAARARRGRAARARVRHRRRASSGCRARPTLRYRPALDGVRRRRRWPPSSRERRERATWRGATPRTGRTSTSWSSTLDGRSLRRYGSQGEQRAALLALLFAERERCWRRGRHRR